MVACKAVGEYKRNQEKIRKFCLEETRALKAASNALITSNLQANSKDNSNANDMPGTPSIPTRSNANATKKDSEQKESKQTKKKTITKKNDNTRTRWTKDKITKTATKNQKQQLSKIPRTPKGVIKSKAKHSTPLTNFNERVKQAAIRNSMEACSIRRQKLTTSDTDTSNRSFLIFKTTDPQPSSIKVFYIDAESPDEQSYEIITSNNAGDFLETRPLSPITQPHPTTTATSTLEDDVETNTPDNIEFSNFTKKIKKATEKIYAYNARKLDETENKRDNILPQIVYQDSSNSTNQTVELTKSTIDTIPHATNDTSNEMIIDQISQLHTETTAYMTPAPAETKIIAENKPTLKDNTELQIEKVYRPASTLVCKTPPSSPQPDSISDLNEEDLQALNEIP